MRREIHKFRHCRSNIVIGIMVIAAFSILVLGGFTFAHAQQLQIPTLQVCNPTKVYGKATVLIKSRSDSNHTGKFTLYIDPKDPVRCDPNTGYPMGSLMIHNISMSDSQVQGTITAVTIEQVTSTGKHTPTVYLNGRCKTGRAKGCRFWMTIADNMKPSQRRGTPDVIGFIVLDKSGNRVAYGTGSVVGGDITVEIW